MFVNRVIKIIARQMLGDSSGSVVERRELDPTIHETGDDARR